MFDLMSFRVKCEMANFMTNNFEATGYHTYTAFKWMDCGYCSLSCYVFVYFSVFADSHQKRKVGNKNNILTCY